jgi:hypothetical protein
VLVFARTKHGADALAKTLDKAGIKSAAIHGDKSQGARTRALSDFKDGKLVALVATDIAARGIDIDALPYVINYELPNVPEDYVHRIGRTGRAGMEGEALSLVCHDERAQLKDIEKLIKRQPGTVVIEGFEQSAVAAPRPEQPPRGPRKPQQGRPQTPKSAKNRSAPAAPHGQPPPLIGNFYWSHWQQLVGGCKNVYCGNYFINFKLLVSFLKVFWRLGCPPQKIRLGDLLIQQGLLTEEQLKIALDEQKRTGRKLGRVFVESGYVTEAGISQALARQLRIPFIDLNSFTPSLI